MIIDALTIAGVLASALYLLSFAWFGKETIWVEEKDPDPRDRATTEAPCADY